MDMTGIRLELNQKVDENYVFFCPHALIHLSRSKPMGVAPRLSSYILTALRFGTLIDVDGVVDLETGELKQSTEQEAEVLPVEAEMLSEPKGGEDDGMPKEIKEEVKEEKVKKSRKRSTKSAE